MRLLLNRALLYPIPTLRLSVLGDFVDDVIIERRTARRGGLRLEGMCYKGQGGAEELSVNWTEHDANATL